MKKVFIAILIFFGLSLGSLMASDSGSHSSHQMMSKHKSTHMMLYGNAPIGLMAGMHHGGFMLSIKQGHMEMTDNILDGKHIPYSEILSLPNSLGSQPKNLSVVPTNMKMQMTMISLMYASTEKVNFMAMGTYTSKDMKLNSYRPMMGRDLLGSFSTSSSDFSDFSMGILFKLKEAHGSRWHMEVSFQNSTGRSDTMDTVLTPMGTSSKIILPYGMQSGDDATRLLLSLTNVKKYKEKVVLGNQLKRKSSLSGCDWCFGDELEYNTWVQYELKKSVSLSTRIKFTHRGEISGRNPLIKAPVQTANPKNYGGKELHLGLGVNFWPGKSTKKGNILGIEVLKPIVQNKNNLQMKSNYQIILGYERSF